MNQPRLSICIATLNRAAFIGETLQSILSQATDEVEIVIVDGASTDNTQEVIQGFQARFPRLRYTRLAQKGGVDQDYNRTVELARGEYVWLFTDDDILKPGAVSAVLAATSQGHDLIVVNAEVRDAQLDELLRPGWVKVSRDRVYAPGGSDWHQFMADAGFYLSFIGGVVIRREVWSRREREKYFGSLFIHVGVIFQRPMEGTVLVLAEPRIIMRYGNAQWTSRAFEIWMFKFPGLIWSFTDFPEWARRNVEAREPWKDLQRLAISRATRRYSIEEYKTFLKPRLDTSPRRWLCWFIAVLPVGLLNFLGRIYLRRIVRKVPCMTLFDLEDAAGLLAHKPAQRQSSA
jgi:abequosyltransferase